MKDEICLSGATSETPFTIANPVESKEDIELLTRTELPDSSRRARRSLGEEVTASLRPPSSERNHQRERWK